LLKFAAVRQPDDNTDQEGGDVRGQAGGQINPNEPQGKEVEKFGRGKKPGTGEKGIWLWEWGTAERNTLLRGGKEGKQRDARREMLKRGGKGHEGRQRELVRTQIKSCKLLPLDTLTVCEDRAQERKGDEYEGKKRNSSCKERYKDACEFAKNRVTVR